MVVSRIAHENNRPLFFAYPKNIPLILMDDVRTSNIRPFYHYVKYTT